MRIIGADVDDTIYKDPMFFDEWQQLPGGWSIQGRELKKFFDGEVFCISDDKVEAGNRQYTKYYPEEFTYYYGIWENFNLLGVLPNGKGWLDELPFIPDLIKYFSKIYNEIEEYRIKRK